MTFISYSQNLEDVMLHRALMDVAIQAALGATPGRMIINRFVSTGLSTFDEEVAARHMAAGYSSTPLEVEVTTLSEVCRTYAAIDIHFLKIDVEGSERAVLEGADFSMYRPWVVLVEATAPSQPTPSYEAWEPILVDAAYVFVWFDGLNRFYVAKEHEAALRSRAEAAELALARLSSSKPWRAMGLRAITALLRRLRH